MPDEKSSPKSAAEFDYRKSVPKAGNKWTLGHLQINKYLNRPLASLIVRIFYRTRVTPNQLTYLAFLLGLAAAYFFFRGRPSAFVVGGILTQASSIMDCADGMLARARGQKSEFGAYLDMFLDRINEFFLVAGFVLGCYRQSGRIDLLILGFAALGLYFLEVSVFYLTKSFLKDCSPGETAENRGWFLFLIFFFAVINRPDIGSYVFLGATIAINIFLALNFFRLRKN